MPHTTRPDSSHRALGCPQTARLWNTEEGSLIRAMAGHSDAVTAAAWLPCSQSFYTGGLDRKIIQWDLSGAEVAQWVAPRINDLAVCADGSRLVSICAEKKIRLCRLADGAEHWIVETGSVVSLAVSGRYMLVNLASQARCVALSRGAGCFHGPPVHLRWLRVGVFFFPAVRSLLRIPPTRLRRRAPDPPDSSRRVSPAVSLPAQEIHLYDLGPDGLGCPQAPAMRYRGELDRLGRFVIRSGLGGGPEGLSFVASGSEDSSVYVWHREKGALLAVLPGHSGAVNAVSWNGRVPGLLASASDDHTVRLWCATGVLLGGKGGSQAHRPGRS